MEGSTHAAASFATDCRRNIDAVGDEIGTISAQDARVGLEVHDVDGVIAAVRIKPWGAMKVVRQAHRTSVTQRRMSASVSVPPGTKNL